MKVLGVVMLFVILIPLATCESSPRRPAPGQFAAPATQPALPQTVINGQDRVHYSFWQDDKEIVPDKNDAFHLKRAPFQIRFVGKVYNTALLVRRTPDIIGALAKSELPVLTCSGFGLAQSKDDLVINSTIPDDKNQWAALQTWEQFWAAEKENEPAHREYVLRAFKLLPMILKCGIQPPPTNNRQADKFTLQVKTLDGNDFTKENTLHVLVILHSDYVEGQIFAPIKWQSLTIDLEK